MAEDFDRVSFANHLMEAGTAPEAAAAYAALFEAFVANSMATKAHITALQTQIADLRSEIGTEADALLGALRTETALLLKKETFTNTIRKMEYFTYLENLQFMVGMAAMAVIALILLAILVKFF